MAENPDAIPQDPQADDDALKKRLISRIAVAGVLVVALLGGLAVLDALQEPEPKQAPPEVAKVEPEEKPAEAKPEPKADEKAEEKPAEKTEVAEAPKEAKPEVAAEPEHTTSVPMPPPRPARPLTLPATPRAAIMKPSEPAAAPRKPDVRQEIARTSPASPLVRHAPASRPLTAERTRQFVVQMGVFNTVANAEDLRAKLEAIGVPAQIEARVQVGPFATKQEAEAAREKLRAAGLETGILTAIRR